MPFPPLPEGEGLTGQGMRESRPLDSDRATIDMNGTQHQSRGGGGASTSRLPLCCGALTTPSCSICSIRRAARL